MVPAAPLTPQGLASQGLAPQGLAPQSLALDRLRASIARLERGMAPGASHDRPHGPEPLPFGVAALDDAMPAGGLPRGALHEVAGAGLDREHGAVGARFAAGILARMGGPVLWVMGGGLGAPFAPGLASAGLHPDRVVFAEAGRDATLLVMEEGLRQRGLAGVVAELAGPLTLTASRRLQLAAEASGTMAILLHRQYRSALSEAAGATAATTRWRIAALPSGPALPHAPQVPGLAVARWRIDLTRCRGGRTGSWIMEACDATGRLGLAAVLGHGSAAPGGYANGRLRVA